MSLGASLFDLFNRRRPAEAVMAAGKGDQPGVPPDPEATGSTGQAQQAPPPNAVGNGQTPPDLGAMYEQLVKRQESARSIDSGMTLMAAGLAHDQNRASLINLAGQEGGRGMSSPESVVKTLSEIQQQKDAAANFAQMGKNLGAIGGKYGLDAATMDYLHRSGKLPEALKALAEGKTEQVEKADGSKVLIDSRTGKVIAELGGAKPVTPSTYTDNNGVVRYYDPQQPGDPSKGGVVAGSTPKEEKPLIHTLPDGSQVVVDPKDPGDKTKWKPLGDKPKEYKYEKGPGGSIIAIDPTMDPADPKSRTEIAAPSTDDIIEYNKAKTDSKDPAAFPSLMDWILATKKAGASSVSVTNAGSKAGAEAGAKARVESFNEERKGAVAAGETITSIRNAQKVLDDPAGIITGDITSPYVQQGRKVIANMLGIDDKKAQNTDEFNSAIRTVVLPKLKAMGQGTSISNTDRIFIEEMLGASGTIGPKALKRILVIQEKIERAKLYKYNRDVQKERKEKPEIGEYLRDVDEVEPSPHLLGQIPKSHIEQLRADVKKGDKTAAAEFDEEYGTGMSKYFLGEE